MGSDTNRQFAGKRSAERVDLRAKLRIALIDEFQRTLSSAAALTEEQRNALNKLVVDDSVTSQSILKALKPVSPVKEATKNE